MDQGSVSEDMQAVADLLDAPADARDMAVDLRNTCDMETITRAGCEELAERYRAVLDAHRSCTRDEDCVVAGPLVGDCDEGIALGSANGDPINRSGLPEADHLYCLFDRPVCRYLHESMYEFDAAPQANVRCEDNRCTGDYPSCLDEFDM